MRYLIQSQIFRLLQQCMSYRRSEATDRICKTRSLSAKGERRERTVPLVCPLGNDSVGCFRHQDSWFKGKQEAEIHVSTLVRLHAPKMLFVPSVVLIFSNTSKALSSSTILLCSVQLLMQNKGLMVQAIH